LSEQEIADWMWKFGISQGGYVINSDGEVDVVASMISLNGFEFTEIPIKFGKVKNFWCNGSNITTLKNTPKEVDGYFYVGSCKLTSLEYSPIKISYSFSLFGNPIVQHLDEIDVDSFTHWDKLDWWDLIYQNPKLFSFGVKVMKRETLKYLLDTYPKLKLYLE